MTTALEAGPRRQRGVALLTALVVLAISATLAAGMIWEIGLDEHRTANVIQGDQAMEYALGAEAWSEQILRRDIESPQPGTQQQQQQQQQQQSSTQQTGTSVNLTQDWAAHLPPLPVQGGSVTGQLQDLQGLFNLNNLVGAQASPSMQSPSFVQFERLLTALNLDPNIAYAVVDWVNPGDQPHFPGGAKDETYSRLQPPYLTAERPMTSISELLLVNGVTPDVYRKLEPYVCALPLATLLPGGSNPQNQQAGAGGFIGATVATPINVNTAPPMVLMSLAPNVDLGTATALAANLATHPFQNTSEMNQLWPQLTNNQRVPQNAGVTSNYFRLTVRVTIGSTHLTMYSLLYRNSNGGTFAIRRTFGTL
ncbi:MAG TPA: type II secretion system minor pseudopilin GspK [Gammaproteobacteria bacterium]|nr:type II secretion system minor pseudopilin GspK [Gammaproteobacteria bacterium]